MGALVAAPAGLRLGLGLAGRDALGPSQLPLLLALTLGAQNLVVWLRGQGADRLREVAGADHLSW